MSTTTAKALYAYVAQEPGDISFDAGDEVVVVQKEDVSGWWRGHVLNDPSNVGTFPSSYVKIVQTSTEALATRKLPEPPPQASSSSQALKVKVLWNYEKTASDELDVFTNDELFVEQSADPEWWYATRNGRSGYEKRFFIYYS